MNNPRILPALAVLAVLVFAAGCEERKKDETPTSGKLQILACESQSEIMREQVDQFSRLYPQAALRMQTTSTRDAIVQLLNDSVRLICVDRALNDEERAVVERADIDIEQVHVAQDALAFVVHRDNPATRISHASIRNILAGNARDWKEIPDSEGKGRILLATTGRNSGTFELLTQRFFPGDSLPKLSHIGKTQRDVLDFVLRNPRALGVVSVATVRDTSLPFRVLQVEHVDSATSTISYVRLHQANIYQGTYPYQYPVYVYYSSRKVGLPTGFSTFIASTPGQKIFLNAGLVPMRQPVRLVQLREE